MIDLAKVFGGSTPSTNSTPIQDDTQAVAPQSPSVSQTPAGQPKPTQKTQAPAQSQAGGGVETAGEAVDTRSGPEKQFDELNEVLDTNLTDEIEKEVFEEVIQTPPVPAGNSKMKDSIEEEEKAKVPAD